MKYFLVVVQYTAKVSSEKLKDFVWRYHKALGLGALAPHLRVADEADSDRLTGFKHNAVSPLGLRTIVPVILSKSICSAPGSYIYLGGGSEHTKLGISVSDFVAVSKALVGDVSDPRSEIVSENDSN
jgi:prolyl-tRNA editing enzyme YbaK/EbsC (Cys-tRNA(Pro) deacylase)